MAGEHTNETHDRLSPLLTLLSRVGSLVAAIIASRASDLIAFERNEVRRAATMFALSFTAAIFACAAAGFAALSILIALGEEHRAAGAALIAGCFALLSGLAILLVRNRASGP